ncbi:MAG: RagB/SusD family nutrient uptake outer membrane protein [Candidatus Symbiothrix sp.]|jgi:hypothetical protein|nr:RagB/SusD family nutrient uptake outer membrane protein [Candidatus Symbiothrix sp.]
MKIIGKKTTIGLMLVFLFIISCSDSFLERNPESNYTGESYYSSDAAILKAVEPLYNRAWFPFNNRAMLGLGSYRANDAWNPYSFPEFARFQTTALTQILVDGWGSLFMVVTMSNSILNDVQNHTGPDVTEAAKKQAMGEAYLMRGAAYFYMLRIWGSTILFEDNDELIANPQRPLNPEEDVLKFVIRDFRKAAALLPSDLTTNGRASQWSAKALLAKALLAQSGWNKGTRDQAILDECISICEDIIDHSGAGLIDYEDLFKMQYNNSKESLFAMQWALPPSGGWGSRNSLISDLSWADVCDVNCWGESLMASLDMIEIYNEDPKDTKRLKANFFYEDAYYDYIKSDEGGYTYDKKWMHVKKGVVGTKADNGGHLEAQASPLNTYIIRYADVLLIHAEASLGNSTELASGRGLESFNLVRNRAGVDPKSKITFADLIRERRIEFCMEYCTWFDMVTWYRWQPEYMLDYFNNKQHRAYEIQAGGIDYDYKEDGSGTIDYWLINWFDQDNLVQEKATKYWRYTKRDDENNIIQTEAQGYVFPGIFEYTNASETFNRIKITPENVFLPYPEVDVLQNSLLKGEPQPYNFSEE